MRHRLPRALPLVVATVGGLLALVLNGCASTRFTASIGRVEKPNLPIERKFRIVSVEPPAVLRAFHSPVGYYQEWAGGDHIVLPLMVPEFSAQHGARLTEQLVRTSVERYPDLFSTSSKALPLAVRITEVDKSDYSAWLTGAVLLTAGVVGGVLPSPTVVRSSSFQVRVSHADPDLDLRGVPIDVERTDVGWVSGLSPLGLIPIPGRSDCKKASYMQDGHPRLMKRGGQLTLDSFVDATVKGLESMNWSKLPGYIERKERSSRIAVLDLRDLTGAAPTVVAAVTEAMRVSLGKSGWYNMLARDEMDRILKEQHLPSGSDGCDTTACAVEYGQALSVEKIVIGSLARVGGTYQVVVKLVNVPKGECERIESARRTGTEDVLLELAEEAALRLGQ